MNEKKDPLKHLINFDSDVKMLKSELKDNSRKIFYKPTNVSTIQDEIDKKDEIVDIKLGM